MKIWTGFRRWAGGAGLGLVCVLALGWVVCFYSERLFWAMWRPGDHVGELVVTWLAYCALAYAMLCVWYWGRPGNWRAMLLLGGVYGYLCEGMIAGTVYGPDPAMPLSFVITSLSWHAPITVLVGVYWLPKAMAGARWWAGGLVAAGIGVFWGLWAPFEWGEGFVARPGELFTYAAVCCALLGLGYWVVMRLVGRWRPGWVGCGLSLLVLLTFFGVHVSKRGMVPVVVLPLLLGACLGPIWRGRGKSRTDLVARATVRRLMWLAVMPVVAVGVYALAWKSGGPWAHVPKVLYLGMAVVGGGMVVYCVGREMVRRRAG